MTQPESSGKTLKDQALALQAEQRRLDEATMQALGSVRSNPDGAYVRCQQLLGEWDTFFAAHDVGLRQMGAWGLEQIPQSQEDARVTKAQLLGGMAQAAFILQRVDEAKSACTQALELLPDARNPGRAILLALRADITRLEAGGGTS